MKPLCISYDQAQDLVEKYVTDPITKLHLKESEVIMRALAKRFGEDEEQWGIIGLLHDIDWDLTKNVDASQHCIKCVEILHEAGASEFLIETIQSHAYGMDEIPALKDKQRTTNLQYCLIAAETLTGLIYASALILPDKKLMSLKLSSLKKRFKETSFSERCDRDKIRECEKAGIPIDEFLQVGLESMQNIANELGM